ncbi:MULTISPECIES: complex I subunit 1 family protein [Amycolatopsis]|uniref:NADH-quinone oxidoreductase subunit H n=1 Tax=Amycolatopsis echigonensis TaxID=2576905 RepID=A0A2N3WLD4_9PSEU|nr:MULTISPECIES: complex I subunit 1 family protein [Amycolatopsis]MBB2500828.1 NADH-quinone oxidoreductase subunit H [Amycolatopsis echigonensis]MCG3751215.1 NADH-quinone oxidoreductase subunit H [Amycolatopsis sp. Poz14]PKV94679.1 NADH-quinone oxidoreductase subunit H [Amycolatopsis niigatensis]
MRDELPWWAGLLLPLVLAALAAATASTDAVLTARTAGAPARQALTLPLRDLAGFLVQQRRRTLAADVLLGQSGAVALLAAAVLASLVTPFGQRPVADFSIGIVWFNAMEVVAWAAVWLVGWGANSAYGLVGSYRFIAQGLAYELPHMFALITAALGAGSLRVPDVVAAQSSLWFAVWMPAAFAGYLLSVPAMAFWGPFDHPVGSDASGGAAAELSGVDRLVFLGGRWLLLVSGAAFAVPLFLGGGAGPLLPPWLWSVVKTLAVLAVLVWLKRRLPTVRMERYQEIAWVVLIPVTLVQALVVAVVVLVR